MDAEVAALPLMRVMVGGAIALGAAVVATGGLLGAFWRPEREEDVTA